MTADRPRLTAGAWVIALFLAACALASGERLVDTLFVDDEPVAWAQVVRIASCVLALASSLVGVVLVLRGHHRRMSGGRAVAGDMRATGGDTHERERQTALARAVTRTFPLTMCFLLLALALTTYVATFPEEPAFVRVLSTTGALISLLWSLGAVSTRVRASRRLRDDG